jgi:hypothetical protein
MAAIVIPRWSEKLIGSLPFRKALLLFVAVVAVQAAMARLRMNTSPADSRLDKRRALGHFVAHRLVVERARFQVGPPAAAEKR